MMRVGALVGFQNSCLRPRGLNRYSPTSTFSSSPSISALGVASRTYVISSSFVSYGAPRTHRLDGVLEDGDRLAGPVTLDLELDPTPPMGSRTLSPST